ncbi:2-amino-4-hydroxy-6-hydroxymethyldihydropteridine diphosphokinase [Chelativorans sp. Marseille-P2723]|uniref:2-amino-4-hydroxy-6- hydroxymethyldihydropteridine diphosphokinase n=1 Tax=Chelativorans sp. Marseille-P2723 TaxID=2709133 RepID=UPI002484AFB9|nr:2-amino-4-hydroxy-6-hydroxymethyldihydropteridine diphosphokinase [Chelativorans sp. Marseille-P2723]
MLGRSEVRAFLGLGGNVGEPEKTMAAALRALDSHDRVRVVQASSLYRTPPWGKLDQPDFLNAAAEIATGLKPQELLALCLDTERALKRERVERWGPRNIDIDILTYGDRRIDGSGLEIPHPRMLARAFVLLPLAEIAPRLILGGRPIEAHLSALDSSGVERLSADGNWWRG